MPKKKRMPLAESRFGGRATAGGVNYEVRVAAWIAVKMLAGDRCVVWEGISGADISAIMTQAPEPVDDVVVSLREGQDACVYISAKERAGAIPLTPKSPAFGDTVRAFVRQFLKLPQAARSKSRFVWAVPSSAGRAATQDLAIALDNHREDAGGQSLSEFLRSRGINQRKAVKALLGTVGREWRKETGSAPTDDQRRSLLQCIYVWVIEFEWGRRQEHEAESDIRTHLVEDPKQAKRAWRILEHLFARADHHGIRVTASSLRRALTADGAVLKSVPEYAPDIARLVEFTTRNLANLREHTTLRFGRMPSDAVHLHRGAELSALLLAVKSGHCLITGEPGCGKSGLIYSLVEALQMESVPVVLLLAEGICHRDWKGSANLPGLAHALDIVLANWPAGHRGLLVTDALDAVRDVAAQRMLRRLLCDVKDGQSGWIVVGSVREFDLKHSRELRESFPGAGVPDHSSSDFAGVAHFHLGGLHDENIGQLVSALPAIGPFIESARANAKSHGIHRSPFFLRLAADLIRDGVSPARLADLTSPAVLLRRFWELRVKEGEGASAREVALSAICRRMVDLRSMALSTSELSLGVSERDAIVELRSRGILRSTSLKHAVPVAEEEIRFSHHILHDYALARTLIPTVPDRFCEFATRESLLPVFYRQSFMFGLEEVWDCPEGSGGFWACALRLESVNRLHALTRSLAPMLAARRVESLADLAPLLDELPNCLDADAAPLRALRHLASGLQDTTPDLIRIGAVGWCAFARRLALILGPHPAIEGPLVLILSRLNAVLAGLDSEEAKNLNFCGRSLIKHHVAKEVAKGWRFAALTGIEAVCRTFNSTATESEHALLSLLSSQRLAQLPHYDLFDLAHQIVHLKENGDAVILRLFEAAFSSEPEPGDWESFGGAIMPMRVQTSDNWGIIHHVLAEFYESCGWQSPKLMTGIACVAWNSVTRRRRERRESAETVMAAIQFRGAQCELIEDAGHIWGRSFEHEESRILSRFEVLLRGWADCSDSRQLLSEALDEFARCNRTSMLWTVFMEAGAEHPTTLGIMLEPVLKESLFLTHPDYAYGGTRLLGALHGSVSPSQRESLERLVLDLPKAARYRPDEAYDSTPPWLVLAQNRALMALEEANIVLEAVRELWRARRDRGELVPNFKRGVPEVRASSPSDSESAEEVGMTMRDPANAELFRLCEALKQFIQATGDDLRDEEIERQWGILGECDRALRSRQRRSPKLVKELWGHLVGACEVMVRHADWPKDDERWRTIRRILLKAANDPVPEASGDQHAEEDRWPVWGWPAPRVDAARGLPVLVHRLGGADRLVTAALRRFCRDGSHAVRFNFCERIAALRQSAVDRMWELIDEVILCEMKFSVFEQVLHSLDSLWAVSPERVMRRLHAISARVLQNAPAEHQIHESLAGIYLFRFLRSGDGECEAFVTGCIDKCDDAIAARALLAQLHDLRAGGWLTPGKNAIPDESEDPVRARSWGFLKRLLSAAQTNLQRHRGDWRRLHDQPEPAAEEIGRVQASIDRNARLVDGIATELYFASGAFDAKQGKGPAQTVEAELCRFWRESASLFGMLSNECHPHTVHQVVQALHHLLPCEPREVFVLAMRSISVGAEAGFQHESLAVGDVVKLIQRALADHREIFQDGDGEESDCLDALLRVMDMFVEAGWAEARQLTHRLEEIYR